MPPSLEDLDEGEMEEIKSKEIKSENVKNGGAKIKRIRIKRVFKRIKLNFKRTKIEDAGTGCGLRAARKYFPRRHSPQPARGAGPWLLRDR